MEIWKPVVRYEGLYEVSDMGQVRGVNRETLSIHGRVYHLKGRLRKQTDAGQGYLVVHLSKNGMAESCRVNIIVGEAFHENPNNYPVVMHINDIKSDNRAVNLKWGTYRHNTVHRYEVFGYKKPTGSDNKKSIPIKIIHSDGSEEVIIGISLASDKLQLPKSSVQRHLSNGKPYKNYLFKYVDQKRA